MNEKDRIHIVGAGLSGATLARKFAEDGEKVLVFEKRDHIGGNTFDYLNEYGIRMSKYGAHIFHTSDEEVWQFVNQFSDWIPYEHRVKSSVDGKLVPIPINITTVNEILGLGLRHQKDFENWQKKNPYKNIEVENSRDSALKRIGNLELYEKMIDCYTQKQWDMKPEELEASVLERIPVRSDWNDRYFGDTYEGLPSNGYTDLVKNMLDHENIKVILGFDYLESPQQDKPKALFFTGKIDTYFNDKFGKLEYRSVRFEHDTLRQESFQEAAVVNFPSLSRPCTRIIEYKKFYPVDIPYTTISREYSIAGGEPYYPVPTPKNREIFEKYKEEAMKRDDVYFVGRLANYKYFNMDQAIRNALDVYEDVKGRV